MRCTQQQICVNPGRKNLTASGADPITSGSAALLIIIVIIYKDQLFLTVGGMDCCTLIAALSPDPAGSLPLKRIFFLGNNPAGSVEIWHSGTLLEFQSMKRSILQDRRLLLEGSLQDRVTFGMEDPIKISIH